MRSSRRDSAHRWNQTTSGCCRPGPPAVAGCRLRLLWSSLGTALRQRHLAFEKLELSWKRSSDAESARRLRPHPVRSLDKAPAQILVFFFTSYVTCRVSAVQFFELQPAGLVVLVNAEFSLRYNPIKVTGKFPRKSPSHAARRAARKAASGASRPGRVARVAFFARQGVSASGP